MAPKITDEMRSGVDQDGTPLKVEDDRSKKVYLLIDEDKGLLFQQWLRRELQGSFEQADRGERVDWDPDKIKAEGRRRLEHPQE